MNNTGFLRKLFVCFCVTAVTTLCNCMAKGNDTVIKAGTPPKHTKEATKTMSVLKKAARRKTPYFGHQDALMYGQNWQLKERDTIYEKSDVYDVCGKYPYILGLDLGRIEKGQERNIDNCLFRQMKGAAIAHHKRGGIVTISWHMDNPVTGSTAWDRTAGNVVKAILSDSTVHKKYLQWLDQGADFMNQLEDKKGRKIPVLFRLLHECNIESFWWSPKSCSDEEYIALWRMTFDYLVKEKKMTQLLWVYSPYDIKSEEELARRYPGDEYVDVIGYERYQLGAATYAQGAERFVQGVRDGIDVTVAFAEQRKKIVAITETGFPGVPYDKWWTEALGKAINNKPIAYVHLWRNGLSKSYYFGPCAASKSKNDFNILLKTNKIKMLKK